MYFQAAKWGKNGSLRYIAGFIITFFLGYALLGSIPLLYVIFQDPNGMSIMNGMSLDPHALADVAGSKNGAFILLTSIFLITMAIFWFVIHVIHEKRMKWIATGARNFRWNQFWFAFLVGALVIVGNVVLSNIMFPGDLKFRFDPKTFGILVLIASIMIPIQAGWEELFFRGYLMQGFGLLFKNKIAALVVTTLLFAGVHMANPEVMEHGVATMFPMYFIMGLSFGLMVILGDGLELAMGYHIANNFWLSLLLTSPESVLQTDSLFYTEEVQDASGQVFPLIVFNLIVLAIFAWRYGWLNNWQERLFGAID